MAKGGYQRRRIEAKKAAERAARKRARRRKQAMTWLVGVVLLALIGLVAFAALSGDDDPDLTAKSSPTPGANEKCVGPAKPKLGKAPENTIDKKKDYSATMKTSKGVIEIELLDDDAPVTVNNFVALSRQKFYDSTVFHRVIAGFGGAGSDMVQGGDATNCDGTGDPGYSFDDENMIAFAKPGYLAMANGGPGTNGSQFFFLSGTVEHLNKPGTCPGQGCHSVFGRITKGLDVITEIAKSPLENERPNPPIVIESVTIQES